VAATTEQDIAPFGIAKVRAAIVRRGKSSQKLVRAGGLGIGVQVVSNDSGETNLHSHPGTDSAWMVLNGKAKFYTVNDRLLGELGQNEVISIPAGAPYWFEAADEDPLVVLHITSRDPNHQGGTRIDYTPRNVGGENRLHDLTGDFFEG
jgi:mannose-6-phosphate isomerase-like protein (cupin superfamily)